MMNDAGKEHYTLLRYMVKEFGDPPGPCQRHVVDIGTRYVASSLAAGSSGNPVKTFDVPESRERVAAFRGKTEQQWQQQVKAKGVDITFYNLNLAEVSDEDFHQFVSATWFVMLDTHHKPYTVPFEREFLERLVKAKFKGLLMLDDIHLHGPQGEMERWWAEVQANAERDGYRAFDVTKVGHASGTGLLDFSGKVEFKTM